MTKQGLKAIEEIKVGDQVLSYNDNLEIFEYKDVVEVYNNETKELCHIYTETEEIVCTPNHNVLTIDGWKEAKELTVKDLIKTSIGYIKELSIKIEQLEEKQAVYNFNVLGYHTYVVGKDLLVVHNKCSGSKEKGVYELDFDDGTKYIGKGSRQRMQQSIKKWTADKTRNLVDQRFTPCTNDKAAFIMEHIKMVESGFGQVGCKLLNSINSPGKKLISLIL